MQHQYPLLLLFVLLFSCNSSNKKENIAATENRPPNIVLIFTDDQGYQDLSCYGSPTINTPNIDQMAKEGAKFTNFYVSQPVCSASRASLLTGCYANRIGISGMENGTSVQNQHYYQPDKDLMTILVFSIPMICGRYIRGKVRFLTSLLCL